MPILQSIPSRINGEKSPFTLIASDLQEQESFLETICGPTVLVKDSTKLRLEYRDGKYAAAIWEGEKEDSGETAYRGFGAAIYLTSLGAIDHLISQLQNLREDVEEYINAQA